jgi:hypothetical protein
MSRWSLAFVMVGTVLVCGVAAQSAAPGSDGGNGGSQPGAAAPGGDPAADPAQRIDKAIQAYESRADQELSQIRAEIDKHRKELFELSELQFDMAIALAELQAAIRVQASLDSARDGEGAPAGSAASPTAEERQRLRAIELARELRPVQESLRSVVQQKKGETEQLVIQLRRLRASQRQTQAGEGQAQTSQNRSR